VLGKKFIYEQKIKLTKEAEILLREGSKKKEPFRLGLANRLSKATEWIQLVKEELAEATAGGCKCPLLSLDFPVLVSEVFEQFWSIRK
jgi:hypothetical protein